MEPNVIQVTSESTPLGAGCSTGRMEQCTTIKTCATGLPIERKEDNDEANPQVKAVRSSKFWFEDGNVVLQAEHTQFRLHRSVLSIHCPIFQDMFACSQPENGPMIDGCPLVHLSEKLEDVRNFVKILYRSIKTYNRSYRVTVSLLKTMLHFGRKYDMKQMRQEAVHCLKLEFPPTLRRWTLQVFGSVIYDIDPERDQEIPTVTTSLFEILYLAYEHSITTILPALYLRICLTHNAQEITEAFQCVAKKLPFDNKLLINCLSGRERLHRSVSSLSLTWLYDNDVLSSSDCLTQCQKERSMLITKLWNNDIQFTLKFALNPSWDDTLSEGLCLYCSQAAKLAYARARVTNWRQLKTYFGLLDLEDEPDSEPSYSDSDSSQSDAANSAEELVEYSDEAGLGL